MKYDYTNYKYPLCDSMKDVEVVYKKYLLDEDNADLYEQLKEVIYALSLDIKSAKVCNQISPSEAEDMKKYYWDLLL